MVEDVAFSNDGKKILTGSRDKTAILWDLDGNQLVSFEGHTHYITSVAFSTDGKSVLTGSWDDTAKLWDLNGNELKTYYMQNSVLSVDFSPSGDLIVIGDESYSPKIMQLPDAFMEDKIYAFSPQELNKIGFVAEDNLEK